MSRGNYPFSNGSRVYRALGQMINPSPAPEKGPNIPIEGAIDVLACVGRAVGIRIINSFATIPPINRYDSNRVKQEPYPPLEFSRRSEALVGAATIIGSFTVASIAGLEPLNTSISALQL